jgi:hypothetical protein
MTQRRPVVRFQHLELTFPRGELTQEVRDDIDQFWCGLFGWTTEDYPVFGQNQHRLYADEQMIAVTEADEAMTPPAQPVGLGPGETVFVPHLGIQLESLKELDRVLAECRRYQEKDPRVKIWDATEQRFPGVNGLHHAFLLMYILPIWFDMFAVDFDPGGEPPMKWRYGPSGPAEVSG